MWFNIIFSLTWMAHVLQRSRVLIIYFFSGKETSIMMFGDCSLTQWQSLAN